MTYGEDARPGPDLMREALVSTWAAGQSPAQANADSPVPAELQCRTHLNLDQDRGPAHQCIMIQYLLYFGSASGAHARQPFDQFCRSFLAPRPSYQKLLALVQSCLLLMAARTMNSRPRDGHGEMIVSSEYVECSISTGKACRSCAARHQWSDQINYL